MPGDTAYQAEYLTTADNTSKRDDSAVYLVNNSNDYGGRKCKGEETHTHIHRRESKKGRCRRHQSTAAFPRQTSCETRVWAECVRGVFYGDERRQGDRGCTTMMTQDRKVRGCDLQKTFVTVVFSVTAIEVAVFFNGFLQLTQPFCLYMLNLEIKIQSTSRGSINLKFCTQLCL